MEHAGHNHDGVHPRATSIAELRHPPHGSYEGHVVPGVMFIAWSSYWIWSIIDIHLRSRPGRAAYLPLHSTSSSKAPAHASSASSSSASAGSSRRSCGVCACSQQQQDGRGEPFRSRAWYPWPYWPVRTLEPVCKVLLPLLGVAIELYIGWGGWRPLFAADGHFAEFHANNWQHAVMYGVMAVSGAVDLIGAATPLPPGTEQGFLALAFLVETLLMGLHSKPNHLDSLVHLLLTAVMVTCGVVSAAEIAAPHSLLLALLRGMAVFLQGSWFWHVGAIMFRDSMAWDMDDMAAVMFVPVVFCLHIILIALGTFSLYLFMRCLYQRLGITPASSSAAEHQHHRPLAHHPAEADSDLGVLLDTQLEMAEYSAAAPAAGAGGAGISSDTHRARDTARKGANGHII